MAQLKTLKHGELYLMKDGSAHQLLTGTTTAVPSGYVHDGTWNIMLAATDLFRRTGNHFLSHDYDASSTTAFNLTHAVIDPVFHSDGTNVHMWYGYDGAGGSAYAIYYAHSADGGATWTDEGIVIALGTGGSWNDSQMWPVGVRYVDANTTYLFVAGNDGATWKLGRWTIDTSGGGGLTVEYASAINYSAYGSNPVTGDLGERYAAITYAHGAYHMIHDGGASSTKLYYNRSKDGLSWPDDLTTTVAMRSGASGTKDDGWVRTGGIVYEAGWFYLFYTGNDGTNSYPMLALSEHPDRLVKCGNIEAPSSYAQVPFGSDMTFPILDQHQHISNRGRPGVIADALFEGLPISFSMRFEGISSTGIYNSAADGETGRIFDKLLDVDPSVREGSGFATSKPSVNILYRQDSDDSGTKDDFWLFLDCHPVTTQFSESGDGNTVNVSMVSYGGKRPLWGRY